MALTCGISINTTAVTADQSPGASATLTVYNPNASAVVVTGARLTYTPLGQTNPSPAASVATVLIPTGPGQTVSVPALGSITFGPFPVQAHSPSNSSSYNVASPSGGYGGPIQGALPSQEQLIIGAVVEASDGSSNVAAPAGLTVSYYTPPPLGSQGGFLNFADGDNFLNGLLLGVL